jgi:hypothetical protein
LEHHVFPKHRCKGFPFLTHSKAWLKMLFPMANVMESRGLKRFVAHTQLLLEGGMNKPQQNILP